MAIITTTLSPTPEIFMFRGISDIDQSQTMVPRGEVIYKGLSQAVAAGGVGDSQNLVIFCDFPDNFAYAIAELHMQIIASDVSDWDAVALAFLVDGQTSQRTYLTAMEGFSRGISNTGGARRIYNFDNIQNAIMLPKAGVTGAFTNLQVANLNLDGVAATVDFMCRFYLYDVDQAHHFAVNSPQLIR